MRSTPQSSRALRSALFVAALGAIVYALFFARPPSTPGPRARDFEAYYAAGQAAHLNPYSTDIWNFEHKVPGVDGSRYEFLPFVGPPHGLPLWALFAHVPYTVAAAIWTTLLIGAALVAMRACAVLCGAPVGWQQLLMLAPIGVAFAPLTSAIALGQVALLSFAAMLLAMLTLAPTGTKAAVALVLAALQPNVSIGFIAYAFRSGARRALVGAALGVALLAAIAFWRSPDTIAYLRIVREHSSAEKFDAIQLTPAAILAGFGLPTAAASALALLLSAIVVGATLLMILRRKPADPLFGAALVCAATPFVMPFFHEHDLVVALLPIFYCALRVRGGAALIGAAAGVIVAVDWLGLAQRPGGFTQSLLLAFAFAVLIAQQYRDRRAILFALAPMLLVIALGILAQAHPAPIWPDALPHGFTQPPGASAAQAWEAEQRASDLFAINPTWALLRACSLAGCAGLWLALSLSLSPPRRTLSS